MLIVDLFMSSNTGGLLVARQLVLQGKTSRERKKKQQQIIIIINGGFYCKCTFITLIIISFFLDLPPVEPLPIDSAHKVSMVTAGTPHNFLFSFEFRIT